MLRWLSWAGGFLVCLFSLGCGESGPELGQVTGQVTMDGNPLPNAIVTFSPAEGGRASIGKTDASGNYSLVYIDRKGALPGKHRVSVTTAPPETAPAPEMSSDSEAYRKQGMASSSDYSTAAVTEPIPARYNSQTELTKDVAPGDNVINLELTSGA